MGDTSITRNKERPIKTIGQRETLVSRYLAHPFQHSILLVEIHLGHIIFGFGFSPINFVSS